MFLRRRQIAMSAWCLVAMVFGQVLLLPGSIPQVNAAPVFHLPWEAGSVWEITSDNNGGNHADQWNAYAFDAVPDPGRSTKQVTAIADGRVIGFQADVPNEALFTSGHAGNCMMIEHSDGNISLYAHLAAGSIPGDLRRDGAEVRSGMVIGTVGNTGYADGVHLHWSLVSDGFMYDVEGYRTCAGTSIPSKYADNDAQLIEDGGVPRSGRYYESTNVDSGTVQSAPADTEGPTLVAISYDRDIAVDVAFGAIHEDYLYENDSANLVSKALWGGGLPRTDDWTSTVVSNPDELVNYLITPHHVDSGRSYQPATRSQIDWSDNTAQGAQLGDVIAYDWEGDGIIDHVAIVTNINDSGYPEVSQHSPTEQNRYWSYSNAHDNWIEFAYPGSVAYLIRIAPMTTAEF